MTVLVLVTVTAAGEGIDGEPKLDELIIELEEGPSPVLDADTDVEDEAPG